MKKYNLIFLRNSKVILSKKAYSNWTEIQDEFDGYLSSLDFETIDDLIEYLNSDYKIKREQIKNQIDKINMVESNYIEINLGLNLND